MRKHFCWNWAGVYLCAAGFLAGASAQVIPTNQPSAGAPAVNPSNASTTNSPTTPPATVSSSPTARLPLPGPESATTTIVTNTLATSTNPPATVAPVPAGQPPATNSQAAMMIEPASSTGGSAADQELVRNIKRRLESDRWVPSYKIGIGSSAGNVTLSGTVDSLLVKERAALLAAAVPGVRAVDDQVVVSVAPRQDWQIKSDVPIVVKPNGVLDPDKIQSEVEQGIVTLSGIVDSEYKKLLAGSLVKGIPGVRAVENQLEVAFSTSRSDKDILAEIVSKLQWDPSIGNPQVSVKVDDGRVELAGFVEGEQALERATRAAWVSGVTGVDAKDLRVVSNMRAAFLPPTAPEVASEEPAPKPEVPVTSTDRMVIEERATNSLRTGNRPMPAGRGESQLAAEAASTNAPVGGTADETTAMTGTESGSGTAHGRFESKPGLITSIQNVLHAPQPAALAGQQVRFNNVKVLTVMSDHLVFVGSDAARLAIPVRLVDPVRVQPGQTVALEGVLVRMPAQITWTDVPPGQVPSLQKSPLYVNAVSLQGHPGR